MLVDFLRALWLHQSACFVRVFYTNKVARRSSLHLSLEPYIKFLGLKVVYDESFVAILDIMTQIQPEIFLKLSRTEQKVRCFFCKKLTVCSDVENSIIHGHHMASVSAGCNRTVIAILTLKGGRRTGPNGSGATRVADSQ